MRDVGRSACVDRRWRSIASDDSLWKFLCAKHLQLSTPCDHHGNLCPSYKDAYKVWHENFSMYPFSLVLRTKRCWDSLRKWTSSHCPEVANSLQPGVSEDELHKFEEKLGWKLPVSVRLLYRFCGGQSTAQQFMGENDSDEDEAVDGVYMGLFGGYNFYHHRVDVHFLSLRIAFSLTKEYIPHWGDLEAGKKWVVVAASYPLQKFFLLDCHDGSLHVGTRRLEFYGELMGCVPPSQSATMQDSMLLWLEMYSSRLNSGMYGVQRFDGVNCISLYPELDPLCSEAVTNGVQVRSSAVFVPELSILENDIDVESYVFAYYVRMRKFGAEDDGAQSNAHKSCQLSSRQWMIQENGVFKDEVRGPGVIGQYPLLKPGDRAFVYASYTSSSASKGSIQGNFTFVPGSLTRPEGAQFLVKVAEFPLEVPSFVY